MDNYQKYIALSRYARYLEDEGRRETWEETVDRYIDFWRKRVVTPNGVGGTLNELLAEAREAIVNLEVMPSMRCLMTAGPALDNDNIAGYNCCYLPIESPDSFVELLYILMCGTGVGFSVERDEVNQLPDVPQSFVETDQVIVVQDSKAGWAFAFGKLLGFLYNGMIPTWNTSNVRPAGARLKTFGGRASGPGPLEDLFKFTVNMFTSTHAGQKLSDIQCHDLACKIAEIVVVGGVRRSALISLSNLGSNQMRHAKDGMFWDPETGNPHRALANNSIAYTSKPDLESFLEEWTSLYRSKSGERGIFNRAAAERQVDKAGGRELGHKWGTNPCSEIILRPNQFCNLSEVVVRSDDTVESLTRKVKIATFLGTLQSTLTDFNVIRPIFRDNTRQERLLGVSLTGIMDHEVLGDPESDTLGYILEHLRSIAVDTNRRLADQLSIPPSAAITCVKPSGTVSQLVDSASGIHPRHAPFYIRRVRGDRKDPLTQYMVEAGFPHESDTYNPETIVFEFPISAPNGAKQLTAMEHLKLWKIYQDSWCDHKPSVTISYEDSEFIEIGSWVFENFDDISGISFLPKSDHVYTQAPYEEITLKEYTDLKRRMPPVDFTEFKEGTDETTASQELACVGNSCEIVDVS